MLALFTFYALPSGGKSKDVVVHFLVAGLKTLSNILYQKSYLYVAADDDFFLLERFLPNSSNSDIYSDSIECL